MAGQLHIKWMSESLAASPAGGAFLLAYPLKGMSKRLSLVGDRKITPVADGQGSYRYCVRVPIQRGRQRAAFFRFCARQSVSTHTFDAVALRNFLLTTDSTDRNHGGDMSIDMSKLASGAAYGASAGTIANGLLTRLSPDEWSAVGVLAGILVALFTLGINWYYKRKATLAQIKALQRWPTAPDLTED